MTWSNASKVLGYVLVGIGGLIVVIGLIGVYMKHGFSGVQDTLSPFNVLNYILTLIIMAPGFFFLWLGGKLEKKHGE